MGIIDQPFETTFEARERERERERERKRERERERTLLFINASNTKIRHLYIMLVK